MIGKVDPASLAALVLSRTGGTDAAVRQGPAYGEDAAAIDLGDRTLVVSSDPLSLAAERLGTLGVHVAGNDVAASGADPRWLTSILFLPREDRDLLDTVTAQLDAAAAATSISIVGGHSEYAPALDRPLLALTCLGTTDRFVPTGGAEPGDRIILTKDAGLEATAILATDFRAKLADEVAAELLEEAETYFDQISVVPDARAVRDHATAMHDPTEGGLIDGLLELATAADVRAVVDRDDVPIRAATAACCQAMDVDPLAVFGSGALLATVPEAGYETALTALDDAGIDAATIGTIEAAETPALVLDGDAITEPVRDQLYVLWE
jgi:hydrogenase expression/formation protein HypE